MLRYFSYLTLIFLISGCAFNAVFFPVDERPNNAIAGNIAPIQLTAPDGTLIQHYLFKPAQAHKATIFAFQGSGSKVVNWHKVIKPLIDDGYQVFMMDYRGFGESKGEASHLLVAQDASRAFTYLINRDDVKNKPVLLLGQSYGGQLAIYTAHQHAGKVDALITEGTFTSFSDEAAYSSPWFVRPLVKAIFSEPYTAKNLAAKLDAPWLIIHSINDKIVPFSMATALHAQARQPKTLWQIEGKHVAGLVNTPEEFVAQVNKLLIAK